MSATIDIGGLILADVRHYGATPQVTDLAGIANVNQAAFQQALDAVWATRETVGGVANMYGAGTLDGIYVPPGDWFGLNIISLPWWTYVFAQDARMFARVNLTVGVTGRVSHGVPLFRYRGTGSQTGYHWGATSGQTGIQPRPTVWNGGEIIQDARWTVDQIGSEANEEGDPWDGGFTREHNHGIHFTGENENSPCNVKMYDTRCRFTTGNAFYLQYGHLHAQDIECEDAFRGLLSVTDFAHAVVRGFRSIGRWGGFDMEPNDGHPCSLHLSDGLCDNDLDLWLRGAGNTLTAQRVKGNGIHNTTGGETDLFPHLSSYTTGSGWNLVTSSGSKVLLESCRIPITKSLSYQVLDPHFRLWGTAGHALIRNCHFVATGGAPGIYVDTTASTSQQTMLFEGCTWNGSPMTASHVSRIGETAGGQTVLINGTPSGIGFF